MTARQFAATLLLAALACRPPAEPIRIGLAGPLTDPVGTPMRMAAELAVEEINAAGGIDGRPIELVARDDLGDPDSAVSVAVDLAAQGVVAVVGHVYSGTTLAASPIYGSAPVPVPVITPSSSAPELSVAGPHMFRLCPTDLEHGAALATFVHRSLGLSRGAVFYLNDAYGRGVRQAFTSRYTAMGGTLLGVGPYLGDAPDVTAYLDRFAEDSAQFLLVAGNRTEGEAVLAQARERGFTAPVVGGDGLEGIEQAGPLAEGTYVSAAYLPMLDTPRNTRFVETWASRYPDALPPNQPAAGAYDAIYLLADVMRHASPTRRGIREGLASIGSELPPFQGVTGVIAFDAQGDLLRLPILIGVVREGRIVLAESQ